MTFTYRQIVSRIENTLNVLNKDMFIPRRFILSIFKAKAEFMMAQKFLDKTLFRETNLFKWVNCVQMEEVSPSVCGVELQSCSDVSRTKNALPKMVWSRYGPSIAMVTSIDGSKIYTIVPYTYYNSIKTKKNFEKFSGTFAIVYPDNRVYIPDSTVKKVNILLFTLDETCPDANGNCDSVKDGDAGNCTSYWDRTFEIPDKFSEVVVQEALKEISMRIQVPFDANPDNNPNVKTATE